PTAREDPDLVQLLVDAVRARAFSRDHSSAVEPANRAVHLAEQLADPGLIARALVGLGEAHAGQPISQMIELLRRAEPLARAAGDWRTLARVLINQSVNLINVGELEEAVAANRRAVDAVDRSGDTERLRFA